MFSNILIVCSGNVCRSPLAKALFEKHLPHLTVDSAGIYVNVNKLDDFSAHRYAMKMANEFDLNLDGHNAKQLTAHLVKNNDLILTMNHEHLDEIAQFGDGARSKTLLLGMWLGVGDIVDPIGKDYPTFEQSYTTIEKAVLSWRRKL